MLLDLGSHVEPIVGNFSLRKPERLLLEAARDTLAGKGVFRMKRINRWSVLLFVAGCVLLFASNASATAYHTYGNQILDPAGKVFTISGVNWYGAETTTEAPGGLWAEDYTVILNEIKQYGFNTIRIPYSNQNWETDPIPASHYIGACKACVGQHTRDILAMIINYAGSIGLHVILDNHRSETGNSAEANGLWYNNGSRTYYPETAWLNDWVHILDWIHGAKQTQGATDTVAVNYLASDGYPTVIGFDLRNEPHTVCSASGCATATSAQWGSGDGIDPAVNPNPNPFAPACASANPPTCYDWRLAAERAGDDIFGEAAAHGWDYPLIAVEGVQIVPTATGNWANGPYSWDWWGGNLAGVNGNSGNSGAPIVFNAGGNATSLGPAVDNQVVYSAHDYGPEENSQSWFNTSTCYASGCSSSSLADVWDQFWAYINLPGGVNPTWPGHSSYPWGNTGAAAYTTAPVWIGEFGTGTSSSDLYSSGAGSEGQWFTDMVNFIYSSYTRSGNSGYPVSDLSWTYWSINGNDSYAILNSNWNGLTLPAKVYSFLCYGQQPPTALTFGSGTNQCSNTGALPNPQ